MARALGARRRASKLANGPRSTDGRRRIAGSPNRLRRNGCTDSSESGPPRLNRMMATFTMPSSRRRGLPVAHDLDQLRHVVRRRLRHHAMAEIEHEGAVAELVEDTSGLAFQGDTARHQHQGVEIALHADMRLQFLRRPMRADTSID